jgi:hypothetical protein
MIVTFRVYKIWWILNVFIYIIHSDYVIVCYSEFKFKVAVEIIYNGIGCNGCNDLESKVPGKSFEI